MGDFHDNPYQVIGSAMAVHNELGPGLREKPYENALAIELRESGFRVEQQRAYPIYYRGEIVGDTEHAQMLNYLRISKLDVGLIINFRNTKLEWKRVVRSLEMNE